MSYVGDVFEYLKEQSHNYERSYILYNTIFYFYFFSSDSPMDKYQRVVLEEKYGLLEDLPEPGMLPSRE